MQKVDMSDKDAFKRFKSNSKVDIKYFLGGMFIGTFVGLILKGIKNAIAINSISGLPSSGL